MGNMSDDKTISVHSHSNIPATSEEKLYWFVAIVKHNTEKACGEKLQQLGYEAWVPTQQERRVWKDGRVKMVDRIVLPSYVLVHVTEQQRLKEVVRLPFIFRFMPSMAGKGGRLRSVSPVAIVPEKEIDTLRYMLGNADDLVTFDRPPLHVGDNVRVARGNLRGLEGVVAKAEDGSSYIYVVMESLGCAKVKVDPKNVEKIK